MTLDCILTFTHYAALTGPLKDVRKWVNKTREMRTVKEFWGTRTPHRPLKYPEGTQRQRARAGMWVMPTVGLLAGGYEWDKETASHLLEAVTPMMHQWLTCTSMAKRAVKTKAKLLNMIHFWWKTEALCLFILPEWQQLWPIPPLSNQLQHRGAGQECPLGCQ